MTKKGPFFGPQNLRKSRRAKMGFPSMHTALMLYLDELENLKYDPIHSCRASAQQQFLGAFVLTRRLVGVKVLNRP